MPRTIIPARLDGLGAPVINGMAYAAAQTFFDGAPLVFNGSQAVIEATSPITTAILVGFAAQQVDTNPGYQMPNANVTVASTYRTAKIAVWRATRQSVFSMTLVNGNNTPVTAVQADIGVSYGLKPYATNTPFGSKNIWYVDKSQTAGNACVSIIGIDSVNPTVVLFKVLEARLAQP